MPVRPAGKTPTPESQLRSLIAKLPPKSATLMGATRAALRKRFPTANELAYDYGFSIVLAYSPTENGIDGLLALSAKGPGVFLYFSQGPKLPDPKGLLQGKAKMVRFVELRSANDLKDPDIAAFLTATVKQAKIPFPTKGKGAVIIKSAQKKPSPKRTARRGGRPS